MIGETQQQALKNLEEAGLSVDYIGELFSEIMGGDTDVIAFALDEKWSKALELTGPKYGRPND